MHVNNPKKAFIRKEDSISENLALEENSTSMPFSRIISIEAIGKSPLTKKVRSENREKSEEESDEKNDENVTFIKDILGELQEDIVDKTGKEVGGQENRYQCGECGEFFQTERCVESHINCDHKTEDLAKRLDEANENIKVLKRKIERLMANNIATSKENERNKLAFSRINL